ncbi:hypothetical protein KP509_15G004300 [Ceratopteris richardii]|uniref:GPI transamidase component PIG-S n=1 Tax=Ceratopteris richardii TaxID=49495 RepID=A0A8T2T1I6_CERRI|nr:hypothetical protein KP509_15G004300 [Ceratopteris richardii]
MYMAHSVLVQANGGTSAQTREERLYVVSSVLIFFLLGFPVWLKSTEIYRAPLPFAAVEEYSKHVGSSSLTFPCYFHFIFLEKWAEDWNETLVIEDLENVVIKASQAIHNIVKKSNSSYNYGGCGTSFVVMASLDAGEKCVRTGVPTGLPIWPCGLMRSMPFTLVHQNDNDAVDEFLNRFSSESLIDWEYGASWRGRTSGMYTILSIKENGHNESASGNGGYHGTPKAVIGKYRHAWLITSSRNSLIANEEIEQLSNVVVKFFMNAGGSSHSSKISMEEKGEFLPLAADGKAILSFSLLNAEPADWIFDWNFNELQVRFLDPILQALQPIGYLEVESQVLYHTPSTIQSVWEPAAGKRVVLFEHIPFFVNANEWHLDTSTAAAGRSKVLQFAIYIPPAVECPLHLKQQDGNLSKTNGFTSPGWGGVVIFNPGNCRRNFSGSVQHLSLKNMEPIMNVIIAQIRVLFGLTASISEFNDENMHCIPAVNTAFSEWEIDVLLRRRAAADVASSASTLRSLSHLVQSLPNMVIKDEIGVQVRNSLSAAAAAEYNASKGVYHAAAEAARKARSWAEEAFFQPSIMSLLYLPLEHHFAIYTPFFVPVLLHTFLAAFKEIKRYVRACKSTSSS